jgi:NADPH:quinone reductase-like Zn-dependent oxidoreductase
MTTQTVLRLTKPGSFQGYETLQEPIPQIDQHELLIKVRSVALNFRDAAIATKIYPFPVKDNVIPGSDAMGEVVKVGSSVQGFEAGDKVVIAFDPTALYGTIPNWNNGLGGPKDGVLAEYIAVPFQSVVKLPESTLSDAQWASLVCTGTTAWNSLFGNVPLKPGQTVLFQGALVNQNHRSKTLRG